MNYKCERLGQNSVIAKQTVSYPTTIRYELLLAAQNNTKISSIIELASHVDIPESIITKYHAQ